MISLRSPDGARLQLRAVADLSVDLRAKAPQITLRGAAVTIGRPGVLPAVLRSKIKTNDGEITVDASGPIVFDTVKMKTPQDRSLVLETSGTEISFLRSFLRAGGFRLEPTSPSTCDVTGSNRTTPRPDFTACDTISGP